jgi:hypothetical protein
MTVVRFCFAAEMFQVIRMAMKFKERQFSALRLSTASDARKL